MSTKRFVAPPKGFSDKLLKFIELAKEKKWTVSEGFSPTELEVKTQELVTMEANFMKLEAEYKVKKDALTSVQREVYVKFQSALKIISGQFYKDTGVLKLLDSFRRDHKRQKKRISKQYNHTCLMFL